MEHFKSPPTIQFAKLAPAATETCTGTHTITQVDLDSGSFSDTGIFFLKKPPTPRSTLFPYTAHFRYLGLTKADNLFPLMYDHVGQVVEYTLTATNEGNVTLHNVEVSD